MKSSGLLASRLFRCFSLTMTDHSDIFHFVIRRSDEMEGGAMTGTDDQAMRSYLSVSKALADASRVRMLCALRGGDLCVCQVIKLLELAPSTVSKHLSILSQAGLVESRKEGRWVHYYLPSKPSKTAARMTEETFRAVAASSEIVADEKQLEEIRDSNLEDLCRELLCKN